MTVVYSKPNCMQCKMVKKWLTEHEVPFDTVDITEDKTAIDKLQMMGFKTVPVTIQSDFVFAGFDVKGLRKLEEMNNEA